jgi:hypothetical protein
LRVRNSYAQEVHQTQDSCISPPPALSIARTIEM